VTDNTRYFLGITSVTLDSLWIHVNNKLKMNTHVLIPLIAAVAYVPLLVILLTNRPWQRQQKFFLLFLIAALLWSITDIFARSDFFSHRALLFSRVVMFAGLWMMVQYHYFLRSFYETRGVRVPLIYGVLAGFVLLAGVGYIPEAIDITASGIHVEYGSWLIPLFVVLLLVIGQDIRCLWRRRQVSGNVAERNQISYLFLGLAALAGFGITTVAAPFGGSYPLAHLGNLAMACILSYAIITHHMLDVRVVFRQTLMYLGLCVLGLGLFSMLFLLGYLLFDFRPDLVTLVVSMGVGVPVVTFLVRRVLDPWRAKVDQAFIGARYSYRRELSDFFSKIHGVPTMTELGSEFISLVGQSVACQRTCLLFPETGNGSLKARFVYPPVANNPMRNFKLKLDSPVVTWLKRERTILPKGDLAILPEFQSMWQEEREEIELAGVEIFVPLMNRGELVAILAVSEGRDGKLYGVEDIDLLESIATQVAASMEKEYFHEQLREQDKEITLINRLTTIITSSVSVQEIFDGFAQELKEIVDVDWAAITLIDGDEVCLSALSGTIVSPWERGERIALEGTGTEWVCRERKSSYETDLARYHKFRTDEYYLKQGIRSIVYLPLTIKDEGIGSLVLASRKPDAYSQRQIRLLEQVARHIATPIENAQLYARAEQRARVDELTGLFNRRHFEERLKDEIARHSRYGSVFSLLLLDLDNFKTYNDVYGHPSGDVLLSQVGRIIRNPIRDSDQAFRYGGDEFAVILPEASMSDAHIVAERVRAEIAREMEEKEIAVTCSIGVATYPADGVVSGELVTVADTALYYSKRTGGNRVYLSSKILSEPVDDAGTYARRNGLSAIYALVSTVEAKDPYTYGHSRKVNTYAVALAEVIGLSPEEVSRVSTAALLHDIGKIGVPDKVLNKKGKLTKEDWEAIKSHPRLGATIVGNVPNLAPCVSTILHHHERWDGSGYPEGLKGEQISVEARILAIADAFEAMSAARPYRRALCIEKVLGELRRGAGSQFDPELVAVFIGIVQAGFREEARAGLSDEPPDSKPDAVKSH
jgi:diguanylate cyclase (GGDEF)-like protein/putative nucleotidyltransferase with HDIG domain